MKTIIVFCEKVVKRSANVLPKTESAYIARTENEAVLSIEP